MDSESSDEETEMQNVELLNSVLEAEREEEEQISSQGSVTALSSATDTNPASRSVSRVEVALALNKLMEEKLKRLETILIGRLHECQGKLMEIQGLDDKEQKHDQFLSVHCGKPYFKDKNRFTPPDNNDTVVMRNSGFLDMTTVSSVQGWTVKDKREFIDILLKLSKSIKNNELHSLMSHYHREAKKNKTCEFEKKYKDVRIEILALEKKNLTDLALPIDQEYDWDLVEAQLNNRHNANEYRALWKLFLHPSINKATWNKEEHYAVQTIAQRNGFQDWDEIAKLLDTGRTGYQAFVYYRTNINTCFSGKKWTKDEEEYLKRLVEHFKEDDYIPWNKIAPKMPNRTKLQIYNKYLRILEKKGRFLPEEDAVILTCLDKFGPDFKKMSQYLNGRSAQQLRTRYYVLQKSNRISAVWTPDEDRKLVQFMANNDGLKLNYAELVKFFPGKDRINIRSRYLTLVKWMKRNPKRDISKAPRREARRLGHGKAANDLSLAINKLKNRMETELKSQKKKIRIMATSSEELIEEEIVIALVNEKLREETETDSVRQVGRARDYEDNLHITPENISATNLKKLLILMRAKLNRAMFEKNCDLANKYPAILDDKREVGLVKVRSYSKTDQLNEIKFEEKLDIWGNASSQEINFVLPPNLPTITGCKQLMSLVQVKGCSRYDAYYKVVKKNEIFQSEWKKLQERFQLLFIWPLILSNKQPSPADVYLKPKLNPNRPPADLDKTSTPIKSKVAIPEKTYVKRKKLIKTLVSDADHFNDDDKVDVKRVLSEDTFKIMKPYSTSPCKSSDSQLM